MGNPCAILLLIVFSYRCPATYRRRTLSVLYRTPGALIDRRFFIVGAYRARFSAETWKPGPWPLNRGALPIARHAWPVVRGPWCVAGCRCAVRRAPCAVRRGPRFASIDSRAVARGAWLLARGARMGAGVPVPILESECLLRRDPRKMAHVFGGGSFSPISHKQKRVERECPSVLLKY